MAPNEQNETRKAQVQAFETAVKDFVAGYEVDTGEGVYQPSAHEQFLIDMAIRDALADDQLGPAFAAMVEQQAMVAAAPAPQDRNTILEEVALECEELVTGPYEEGAMACVKKIRAMKSDLPPASVQPVALSKDTLRLDFLLHRNGYHFELINQYQHLLDQRGRIAGKGKTHRLAIDHAMLKEQQAQSGRSITTCDDQHASNGAQK